jgi:hypothetical protein
MKTTINLSKPLKVSLFTCAELANILDKKAVGEESRKLKDIRRYCTKGDIAKLRLLGKDNAAHWKVKLRIMTKVKNLPRGRLSIGGRPRIGPNAVDFTERLRTLGRSLGLRVESLDGKAFILDER